MKTRCAIVGAAPLESDRVLAQLDPERDFLLCADGGADHLRRAGLTPDLVMGDLDSAGGLPPGVEVVAFDPVKDDTDTHIAVKRGLALGYRDFLLLGCTGGRFDHTVACLQSLYYLKTQGADGCLQDDRHRIFFLREEAREIAREDYRYLSFFAYGGPAAGVTLRGVKYPLTDHRLTPDFPLGVSNEITGKRCKASVKQGCLLAILARE